MTTVIFAGDPVAPRDFTREATKQEYFPEWFLNISTLIDTNVFARTYDQEQWQHAFGLTALAARVDPETTGAGVPLRVVLRRDPGRRRHHRRDHPATRALFFAALQEVGPDLTNQGVRRRAVPVRALAETSSPRRSLSWGQHDRWPGIDGDDWDGIDNITKIWWDPETSGLDEIRNEGAGVWRFVDGGKRYLVARLARRGLPGLRRGGHVDDLRRRCPRAKRHRTTSRSPQVAELDSTT